MATQTNRTKKAKTVSQSELREGWPTRRLLEIPVIGGGTRTGKPALCPCVPHGTDNLRLRAARRRRAEERTGRRQSASRRCRRTPRERRISRRSAGSDSDRPWGAGPTQSTSLGTAEGGSARGGSKRRRSLRRAGMTCSEGERPGAEGRAALRRTCQDGGLRAIRRRGVSLLASQSEGSGDPGGKGSRAVRRRTAAQCPKRSRTAKEPHGRQRPSRPRSGRGGNRRGGEKPRGRIVPGRQPPGGTDPSAHVVEGGRNPRRGRSRP
jgi:hypothetical protein